MPVVRGRGREDCYRRRDFGPCARVVGVPSVVLVEFLLAAVSCARLLVHPPALVEIIDRCRFVRVFFFTHIPRRVHPIVLNVPSSCSIKNWGEV